jgi:hypothetical protein
MHEAVTKWCRERAATIRAVTIDNDYFMSQMSPFLDSAQRFNDQSRFIAHRNDYGDSAHVKRHVYA